MHQASREAWYSAPSSRVFARKLVYRRHFESRGGGGGQTASTSFNIGDNKRNVEQMLKQSLNVYKLIQHRFNTVSRGWQTVSTFLFNKIEWMLKHMLKSFARALSNNRVTLLMLYGEAPPQCPNPYPVS